MAAVARRGRAEIREREQPIGDPLPADLRAPQQIEPVDELTRREECERVRRLIAALPPPPAFGTTCVEESAMINGSTVIHAGSSAKYYSPPFPRRGEAATFNIEALLIAGAPTLVVDVEHRNLADTSWTVAGSFPHITAAGVETVDISGLKELVRLSYRFTAGVPGNFVHLTVQTPAWRLY